MNIKIENEKFEWLKKYSLVIIHNKRLTPGKKYTIVNGVTNEKINCICSTNFSVGFGQFNSSLVPIKNL